MRLGILTSHPIQYQAPWFRALAKQVELEVFFAHRQSAEEQGKAGFGVAFDWDVDLLSGYQHRFLENVSARPGVHHYSGCDNPEIAEIIYGKRKSERLKTEISPPFDAFVVTGWYLKSFWQAVRACRRADIPVLVRGDSQLQTPRSLLKRLAMEIRQPRRLRQFDGFLTVGKRNREYLEHFGVPPEKIFFAPHFVDNDWFAARAAEVRSQKLEVRREWGARDEDLVALFVGKFIPKKRPQDLLQAMRTLNSQPATFNFVAVFVGSGELEKQLRQLATRENLRVRFAGFKNQSELPLYYGAADILVLPSESETWGLVANEAMACGLPAIVSDAVGCAPDLVKDDVTGYVFPVGDTASLAGCLSVIPRDRQLLARLGQGAKERVKAYSLSGAVDGLLKALAFTIELGAARI